MARQPSRRSLRRRRPCSSNPRFRVREARRSGGAAGLLCVGEGRGFIRAGPWCRIGAREGSRMKSEGVSAGGGEARFIRASSWDPFWLPSGQSYEVQGAFPQVAPSPASYERASRSRSSPQQASRMKSAPRPPLKPFANSEHPALQAPLAEAPQNKTSPLLGTSEKSWWTGRGSNPGPWD